MLENAQSIALVLTGVSSLGAVGAAVGAFLSARETRKVAEAQLLLNFLEDYSTPEMLGALRLLRNWKAQAGDEFEEKWRKKIEANESMAHEVDQARRKVKGHFFNALRLHEAGYVGKQFLLEVASVDGLNILYDIVEPLEYALNPAYDSSRFERIMKICGRPRTGKLIRPIPHRPATQPSGSKK